MRGLVLAALLVGCGGRVAGSESFADASATADASTPADASADGAVFSIDTSEPPPFEPPVSEPRPDAAPLDGAACLDRPSGCASDDPLKPLVRKCLALQWACDRAYVDVDADGCATSLRYDGIDAPQFVACLSRGLGELRFPCLAGTRVANYIDSCTK